MLSVTLQRRLLGEQAHKESAVSALLEHANAGNSRPNIELLNLTREDLVLYFLRFFPTFVIRVPLDLVFICGVYFKGVC